MSEHSGHEGRDAPERFVNPSSPVLFRAARELDVLIPTRERPTALAATLASLACQGPLSQARAGQERFGVVISDQSTSAPAWRWDAIAGVVRVLREQGHPVLLTRNVPPRGMAEQRAYLLSCSRARYVLYLDDDIWMAPGTVDRLYQAIRLLKCGFVGNAPHDLTAGHGPPVETRVRYEEWEGPVRPETIGPDTSAWRRAELHHAGTLRQLTRRLTAEGRLRPGQWRAYKLAWIKGCVLYDRRKLLECGGFDFWPRVSAEYTGEEVVVQVRMMARYGGAGILPSGAYHVQPSASPSASGGGAVPECPGDPLTVS